MERQNELLEVTKKAVHKRPPCIVFNKYSITQERGHDADSTDILEKIRP